MSDGKEIGNYGVLSIDVEREDDTLVLSLSGEADLFSATSLEDQLERALDSGAKRVIVDLSALHFIDSISLRVLVKAALASREDSNRLYFLRGSRQVERVLEISGLKQQLQFLD
jgi:stage II sporulation protein AA (anti-sigma F factor antagonist)